MDRVTGEEMPTVGISKRSYDHDKIRSISMFRRGEHPNSMEDEAACYDHGPWNIYGCEGGHDKLNLYILLEIKEVL